MEDNLRKIRIALVSAAMIAAIGYAAAQQPGYNLFNAVFTGHFINGGSGGLAVPVTTGCTLVGPASDTDGECTASAASGSITFSAPFATAPYCIVADASATMQ